MILNRRKIIGIFVWVLTLLVPAVRADYYVKGILHLDADFRYGHSLPETDILQEWWFGRDRLAFTSTGWRFDFPRTDWRLILDKVRHRILVVDLSERTFIEVPYPATPANTSAAVTPHLAEFLKLYVIDGAVTKTGATRSIAQYRGAEYSISEWMARGDDRFYDRDRTVTASENVPFDWRINDELCGWVRTFFNPTPSYTSELEKIRGFILSEQHTLHYDGLQVKANFRVTEISEKESLPAMYEAPADFRRIDTFTGDMLIALRSVVYIHAYY